MIARFLREFGMVLVLLALCALFTVLTLKRQSPSGAAAAIQLVNEIQSRFEPTDVILAVGAANQDSALVAQQTGERLHATGFNQVRVVIGEPVDLRSALDDLAGRSQAIAAIATTDEVAKWTLIERLAAIYPTNANCKLITPRPRLGSAFLTRSNFIAIVDRIVVIAVIAIGMTMVIVTSGIDLSVGSLVALSGVIAAMFIESQGGYDAPAWSIAAGFLLGTLCCGVVGLFSGALIAQFGVVAFITTLSVMLMARGLALKLTGGFSIYQLPAALTWLGQGHTLGIRNTVILLTVLYAIAHVFMNHTRMGRYIYAVGGNAEAARLSGVPVKAVILFVYLMSGLAAGLGGCIQASQIRAGTPTLGTMLELYVIAAVVLGGTSLFGGTGQVLGTLIGAFIIAVIQNGMNALNIDSYVQQIVLGAVILISVLLDRARVSGRLWDRGRRARRASS